MVFVSASSNTQRLEDMIRGGRSALSPCGVCGQPHLTDDHWEFMQTMPQDPVEMVDDLVKMGVYKENQLRAADHVNAYELRKALFLKRVGRGDPKREKLILALCEQAGGLENAFAPAFCPHAGPFLSLSITISGRRL